MDLHERYQAPRNVKCHLCHRKTASGFDNVAEMPPIAGVSPGYPAPCEYVVIPITCEHCGGLFHFDLLLIPLEKP